MIMELTTQFEKSYNEFESFPINLIDQHLYLPILRGYRSRLDEESPRLFIKDHLNADVPFLDLLPSGDISSKKNIFSDEKLRLHLGDSDSTKSTLGIIATKQDPICRFIFLHAEHGRAKLKLTRNMLARIFSFHQVMPRYLEFLFLFGQHSGPHELRYSGFREQTRLNTPMAGQQMSDLGRSGKMYQICYNLKTIDCVSPPNTPPHSRDWSIRQGAVYHQFDVIYGTTLWIITKGGLDLHKRVKEVTGAEGRLEDRSFNTARECFRSSLAIHMLLAYWAAENWRWYTQFLEDAIDDETSGAIHGTRSIGGLRIEFTPLHLQRVQIWEERCVETETVIGGNVAVLTSMRDFYIALLQNPNFPLRDSNESDVQIFVAQLDDTINDCKMQISRARLLSGITSQRKALILQHMQSQASEEMKGLSIMSQKEAVAMRVITVVTLLYLPATFVSTFFSTDIVKYQSQGNDPNDTSNESTSFSSLAMYRWLQVTLPLTLITLILAWLIYRRSKNMSSHSWKAAALLPLASEKV